MDSTGEEKAGFLEEATQLWGEKVLEPGGIIAITIHFQVSIVINQVVRYLYGASSLNICLIFDQEIFVRSWLVIWSSVSAAEEHFDQFHRYSRSPHSYSASTFPQSSSTSFEKIFLWCFECC